MKRVRTFDFVACYYYRCFCFLMGMNKTVERGRERQEDRGCRVGVVFSPLLCMCVVAPSVCVCVCAVLLGNLFEKDVSAGRKLFLFPCVCVCSLFFSFSQFDTYQPVSGCWIPSKQILFFFFFFFISFFVGCCRFFGGVLSKKGYIVTISKFDSVIKISLRPLSLSLSPFSQCHL